MRLLAAIRVALVAAPHGRSRGRSLVARARAGGPTVTAAEVTAVTGHSRRRAASAPTLGKPAAYRARDHPRRSPPPHAGTSGRDDRCTVELLRIY